MSKARFSAVLMITGSGLQNCDRTLFGHKRFLVWADAFTRCLHPLRRRRASRRRSPDRWFDRRCADCHDRRLCRRWRGRLSLSWRTVKRTGGAAVRPRYASSHNRGCAGRSPTIRGQRSSKRDALSSPLAVWGRAFVACHVCPRDACPHYALAQTRVLSSCRHVGVLT